MTPRWSWLLALLALAVLTTGCDSDVCRHTGQQGEFVFEYYSEKDTHNFNKPIIVDGRVELSVYSVGEEGAVDITGAHSESPQVIRVDAHAGNCVVLRGVGPGRAEIRVEGTGADGSTRVDRIAMRVDEAAVIDFDESRAWITEAGGESGYLRVPTGAEVEIPWTRWSKSGEPLVGYGAIPVEMDPAESADIDAEATDGDSLTLFAPQMPTVFELRPVEHYRGDTLVIEVYESSSLDAVAERAGLLHGDRRGDGHRWCDTPAEWAAHHVDWRAPLWMWLPALLFFPLLWWVRGQTYAPPR